MPTISLCMIVKNEQEVIQRCLSSVTGVVDEIIIVDTGSTDDTVAICRQFTSHIYTFPWQHDFAAARNFSFSKASCQYICWLDADDVLDAHSREALLALKDRLSADVYFLPYDYSQDEYGQTACTLYRERIVRNDGTFAWKYPVHEVIHNIHNRSHAYEDIPVRHARTQQGMEQDKGRNLAILQQAVLQPVYATDARVWFYLGRELHDHLRFEEAIEAFARFLAFENTWQEERVMALFRTAQCHASLAEMNDEHVHAAEMFARKARELDGRWAEPYFVPGELAYRAGRYEEAAFWFRQCLRGLPDVLSPVNTALYTIKPSLYLVFCYDRLQQHEEAWRYNELALQYRPRDAGLLHNRAYLGGRLAAASGIAWYGRSVSPQFPAYRIRAMRMHATLLEMGVPGCMTDRAGELYRYHTVIFFRAFTGEEYQVMQEMKAAGKQVVLDVSENLLPHTGDFPYYLPMITLADVVICCSPVLADLLRPYNVAVTVIEDAAEPVTCRSEINTEGPLKAGWAGMPENAMLAEQLRPLLLRHNCELVTVHTGPGHNRYWTLDDWQHHLAACDFVIAPQNVEAQPAKSANKVTTAMTLGMPVIAAPLPAYLDVIRHGSNGLIADSPEQWEAAILQMRSPALRALLRRNGLHTAMACRPENVALKWWKTLSAATYNELAVDIIIPTIYDTPHIYHCIDSIMACTQVPFNIIVVNSGGHPLQLPPNVQVMQAERLNYAAAVNLGIAAGKASYICIMNDDVIVSDGWLPPLLEDVKAGAGFSNPLSNCDAGFLHNYDLQCGNLVLGAGVNILHEGLVRHRQNLSKGISPQDLWTYRPGNQRRRYEREWVPFFCTVTSRRVIEKTGLLDDGFNNGCEDVDLCRRAGLLGLRSRVNENSFVFHFGGTSTIPYVTAHPSEKDATHAYFREKYRLPLLCIHAGYAYESWNAATIRETGMGGSETAVAALAREMTKRGYRVVVCCHCTGHEGMIDGVQYLALENFRHFIDRHYMDVFVISRYADTLRHPVRAGKKYYWLHDVFAMGNAEDLGLLSANVDELDGIFCLSPWHRNFASAHHQLPPEKFILTGNGIDIERFMPQVEKEQNRFIYSSSPDRSLDVVLRLFPKIRAALPGATLHVYYGFENWERSARLQGNTQQRALIAEIKDLMQQEGVFYHGRVSQRELALAFLRSDIWLYPTSFTETFCITALEAQAAGTLCVCSNLAGLNSTVADRGLLLEQAPGSEGFEAYVLRLLTDIQHNTVLKNELLQRAREWAWQQSWSAVADQWRGLFDNRSAEIDHVGGQVHAFQR